MTPIPQRFYEIVVRKLIGLDKHIYNSLSTTSRIHQSCHETIDRRGPVQRAVEIAKSRLHANGTSIETVCLTDFLPKVWGDEERPHRSIRAFGCQLRGRQPPDYSRTHTLAVKPCAQGEETDGVVVTVPG